MEGKIIKGIAGFYYVHGEDGEVYECRAKGIFRKENQKPLVGDNVEITVLDQEKKRRESGKDTAQKKFPDPSGCGQCGSGICDLCNGGSETEFYAS